MRIIFTLLLLTFAQFSLSAGDAAAGKSKAMICAACHGANGISPNDIWPNLAGQKEGYLIKQIKAFRSGERNDPSMAPMVKMLAEDDIANVAAYFSQMK
jgi:cytochrome c553